LGDRNEFDARQIALDVSGESVRSCERFTTGLRHWVYDVVLNSGRNIVVRLSHPDNRAELAGGVFWSDQLRRVGVPTATVLTSDVDADQPYMVLERLPGTDLGNVFDDLDEDQRVAIATTVVDMQKRAGSLRQAKGFGYALDYDAQLHTSWLEVLEASIERSSKRIRDIGLVDPGWIQLVQRRLDEAEGSFDDVEPTAFLHDATTKNVIIYDGKASGLVDVDQMGFGDPLWAIGLTRMSLLSANRSTSYTDAQTALLREGLSTAGGVDVEDRLDLYTALFCLDFLAELGQRFNQQSPANFDHTHYQHLVSIMASLSDP